jgi:hypothetical protein
MMLNATRQGLSHASITDHAGKHSSLQLGRLINRISAIQAAS